MYCKKCGKKLEADSKFCDKCGEKVQMEVKQVYCTNCGKQIAYNLSICPFCEKGVMSGYSNTLDEESLPLQIVAFLIPIVGLILWATTKEKTPKRADGIIKWAACGFIFFFILKLFFY